MASSIDLVIKLLADTSSASQAFNNAGADIMKLFGSAGAVGQVGFAVVQAGARMQSAMATIEQAYNDADFSQGSAKYSAAKEQIIKDSNSLATSFKDVSDVYSQGARFVDDFGARLPTDKLNEYTETMIRLSKVSTDAMSATDVGQRVDVFEKLFNGQTNFGAVGAAISAESGIHNQGEGPMLDTAIAIAQYGASMGVSQAQALGIGNYLTDLKAGGQMGGASIGRMLLRMDTSADAVLDPETKYSKVKQSRDAQERLDDLQTSLAEAEQKRSEMFGQHGLLTRYKRSPSEVTAADNRIAKLNREIADQQEDHAHLDDPNRSRPRGQMNVAEMAKTAGMDSTAYAELFKENPMDALLAFTRGLHELPEAKRGAAETMAGITNVRDQKTINALSDRPDVAARYIALAQGQIDNPVDLVTRSDRRLGTTLSKEENFVNMLRNGEGLLGETELAGLDAGITGFMGGVQSKGVDAVIQSLTTAASKVDLFGDALDKVTSSPVLAGLLPSLALLLKGGALAGGAAAGAGVLGLGAGQAVIDFDRVNNVVNKLNDARAAAGLPPVQMNIGPFHVGDSTSGEDVYDALKSQFIASWNAAMQGPSVPTNVGGNYNIAP
jgi:hypothetical protein